MAFDEVLFPLQLAAGSSRSVDFTTEVTILDGGYEQRNQRWSSGRRRYDARPGVRCAADAAVLSFFFQARGGRARGFRLRDVADCSSAGDQISTPSVSDQQIGVGDGSVKIFSLVKRYGAGDFAVTRKIAKPVSGSVLIALNGVAIATGWSLDATTGVVTFAEAPGTGSVVSAGFLFDVPVRFDTDRLSYALFDKNTSGAEIPMIEVRV